MYIAQLGNSAEGKKFERVLQIAQKGNFLESDSLRHNRLLFSMRIHCTTLDIVIHKFLSPITPCSFAISFKPKHSNTSCENLDYKYFPRMRKLYE